MKRLKVDIKPIRVNVNGLIRLLYQRPYPFLLESLVVTPLLGRYSFFGSDPFLVIKAKQRDIVLIKHNEVVFKQGNPFDELRKILLAYRVPKGDYPVPFIGGGVGYLGYDLCHFIERLPRTARDDINLPDLFFAFYDRVIAVDHVKNRAYRIGLTWPGSDSRISEQVIGVEEPQRVIYPGANFTRSDYLTAVRQIKEYIAAGDVYQVNLSQRFSMEFNHSPGQLYQILRGINPAPFAAFLRPNPHEVIISSSPERFLRMRHGKVETRPIKGTRPRGKTKGQDQSLKHELYHSIKDNAELAMIVDLERNDLGRVCKYGSVRVVQPRVLESYATVHHLVAQIEGKLHPRYDVVDLLKATFPGGSITGAPKIRAMEIIDELEPTQRGPYTGAIGYLGFDSSMDLSVAIRMMAVNNGRVYFQVGGGIVADSEPLQEYQETLDKGKALTRAIRECNYIK